MLSNEKLKEIEERVKNTTAGSWSIEPTGTMSGAWFYINSSKGELLFESQCYATNKSLRSGQYEIDEEWYLDPKKWIIEADGKSVYYDSQFVANAKSDIIALLDEVKILRKECKKLEENKNNKWLK